jgi:hypothetical protein
VNSTLEKANGLVGIVNLVSSRFSNLILAKGIA